MTDTYNSLRVVVVRPSWKTEKRSLLERIFKGGFWQRTKQVLCEPAVGPDECYEYKGTLWVGERAYEEIKRQMRGTK